MKNLVWSASYPQRYERGAAIAENLSTPSACLFAAIHCCLNRFRPSFSASGTGRSCVTTQTAWPLGNSVRQIERPERP
jgi:hypothetical protein